MDKIEISIDPILAKSPPKLLKYYLPISQKMAEIKHDLNRGIEIEKLPCYIFTGSRMGGKSQFCYRLAIALILDGYIDSFTLGTMTEQGYQNSVKLIDDVLDEADEQIKTSRDISRPIRILKKGGEIHLKNLNRKDKKSSQQGGDLLIIEELEGWNAEEGHKSLWTIARQFKMIIVISNKLPTWAKDFFDAFIPRTIRIDYWENTALPNHLKAPLDKMREIDPEKWHRFIMYDEVDKENCVYNDENIRKLFLSPNPEFTPITNILSIDVGFGGADNSCVFLLGMDINGFIEARLLMDESIEPSLLIQRIQYFRAEYRAISEVWDVQGGGIGLAQMRFHKGDWKRQGLIPFFGKAKDDKSFYNARSEAIILTRDLIHRNGLVVKSLKNREKEELAEEMRATTYDIKESSRLQKNIQTKITSKILIKKELGRSPNKLDALSMGVWGLLTTKNFGTILTSKIKVKGIPSL